MAVRTLADTLATGERDAANSWREPDRIAVRSSQAAAKDGRLVYTFPALSLTVLEFRRPGAAPAP